MKISKTFNGSNELYLQKLTRQQRSSLIESAVSDSIYMREMIQKQIENENAYLESVNQPSIWYAIRSQLHDMVKTYSDIGSVLIGNEHFSTTFHNGYGDGTTRTGYIDANNSVLRFMKFETTFQVNGDSCFIYSYDCLNGEDLKDKSYIVGTIPCGKYDVYHYEGIIALVKQAKWNPTT